MQHSLGCFRKQRREGFVTWLYNGTDGGVTFTKLVSASRSTLPDNDITLPVTNMTFSQFEGHQPVMTSHYHGFSASEGRPVTAFTSWLNEIKSSLSPTLSPTLPDACTFVPHTYPSKYTFWLHVVT